MENNLDAMITVISKLRQFLGEEKFQNFQDYVKVSITHFSHFSESFGVTINNCEIQMSFINFLILHFLVIQGFNNLAFFLMK